jgi:crotonobetainyl-CoA:carnitine CoA-transferase CaiB-like acyl-CoA transferase
LNRGKKSISINLKSIEGLNIFYKLVEDTDIFISNIRDSSLKKLGITYEKVKKVNRSIIYCKCSGYSPLSSKKNDSAYDDTIQAKSGYVDVMRNIVGHASYVPINLADRVTGLHVVYSLLAAIISLQRHKKAQQLHISMYDVMSAFLLGDHIGNKTFMKKNYEGYDRLKWRKVYKTLDGFLSAIIYSNADWEKFFDIVKDKKHRKEKIFTSQSIRSQNYEYAYDLLQNFIIKKSKKYWFEQFKKKGIAFSEVNTIDHIIKDDYFNEIDFFFTEKHPSEGKLLGTRNPLLLNKKKLTKPSYAPNLGENTLEIMKKIGFKSKRIKELKKQKVIFF